jgi:beta-fructofuranosidase
MLTLPEFWVWDSWTITREGEHHLFFLKAPKALGDPDKRHFNPAVGHAVSDDYTTWRLLPDALAPAAEPAWDDYTTWTGSVVAGPDGDWHMFYTGTSKREKGLVQRVGHVVSPDLTEWHRVGGEPVCEADPRWYERLDLSVWHDEAWRDPWILPDPGGDGWHMLVTARSKTGPAGGRGVIGHARSADLYAWEVQPPLSGPDGFGQLEVPQTAYVDGRWVLLFSCMAGELGAERADGPGGVWTAPAAGPLGPFDIAAATRIDHPSLYAPRLVETAPGDWALLGFANLVDGAFVGDLLDPIPVHADGDGTLRIDPFSSPISSLGGEHADQND